MIKGGHHSKETRLKLSKAHIGYKFSKEVRLKMSLAKKGKPSSRINYIHSEETRKKISQKNKGRISPMKGKHHSEETKRKIGLKSRGRLGANKGKKFSSEIRLKQSLARIGRFTGEDNPAWKGGITPINRIIRTSNKYIAWRKSVFLRDKYTCQFCGIKGVILHADHIKPFAYFPKLRFEITNGRTLCKKCHMQTETWGYHGKIFAYT